MFVESDKSMDMIVVRMIAICDSKIVIVIKLDDDNVVLIVLKDRAWLWSNYPVIPQGTALLFLPNGSKLFAVFYTLGNLSAISR